MRHIQQRTERFSAASFGALAAIVGATAVLSNSGCEQKERPATKEHSHNHPDAPNSDHSQHTATANSMLMAVPEPSPVVAGVPVSLAMMIHRPNGSMVREFELTHEKLVHLIIVSEALDYFAHEHPEVDKSGNFSVRFTFPSTGKYLMFADHKAIGEPSSTARGEVQVGTSTEQITPLEPTAPGRIVSNGVSANILVGANTGESARITFELSDEFGKPLTDLQQYLGAMGHLVIISADGSKYVHAHPTVNGQEKNGHVTFDAHFTSSGIYKGWGQFQRGGAVFTIPFVTKIEF